MWLLVPQLPNIWLYRHHHTTSEHFKAQTALTVKHVMLEAAYLNYIINEVKGILLSPIWERNIITSFYQHDITATNLDQLLFLFLKESVELWDTDGVIVRHRADPECGLEEGVLYVPAPQSCTNKNMQDLFSQRERRRKTRHVDICCCAPREYYLHDLYIFISIYPDMFCCCLPRARCFIWWSQGWFKCEKVCVLYDLVRILSVALRTPFVNGFADFFLERNRFLSIFNMMDNK